MFILEEIPNLRTLKAFTMNFVYVYTLFVETKYIQIVLSNRVKEISKVNKVYVIKM